MTQTTPRASSSNHPPAAARTQTADAVPSKLTEGRQRFLSQVVAHSLTVGLRTAKDFIRHFPATEIMKGLADHPRLRANIVVPTIGLNEKVALKKSAASAGEDLQIALEEGVTDADSVLALFEPDDRVRFLDEKKLWAFVVEGEFWKVDASAGRELGIARRHVAFMIDCARANKLVDDQSIVDGLTIEKIVECVPKAELATLLKGVLSDGRGGKPFKDARLLEILAPMTLVEHLSLANVWDAVVSPKIAIAHRYVDAAGAPMTAPATTATPTTAAATLAPAGPPTPAVLIGEEGAPEVTFEVTDDLEPTSVQVKEQEPVRGLRTSKRLGAIDLSDLSAEPAPAVLPLPTPPPRR